jgi:hypothetical protein
MNDGVEHQSVLLNSKGRQPGSLLTRQPVDHKIGAAALCTRATGSRRFWTIAVGVPGGAGARELCKSVEVHTSETGNMAQSPHDRQTPVRGEKFSHGCGWALQVDFHCHSYRVSHHRSCALQHACFNPQTPDLSSTTDSTPSPILCASRTQRLGSFDDEPNVADGE